MSGIKGSKQWFAPELLKIYYRNNKMKMEGTEPAGLAWRGTIKSDVFAEALTFVYVLLGGEHLYGNNEMDIDSNLSKNNPVNLGSKLQLLVQYNWFNITIF